MDDFHPFQVVCEGFVEINGIKPQITVTLRYSEVKNRCRRFFEYFEIVKS